MGDPAKRLRRKDEPGRGKKLKAKSGKRKWGMESEKLKLET
jgi:hypothetical protein